MPKALKMALLPFGLRRSAANYNISKLFFLHPFLASAIYNNTTKNKVDIGKVFLHPDIG